MYRIINECEQRQHCENLKEKGFTLIKSYISKQDCFNLIDMLKLLYIRHWSQSSVAAKAAPLGIQNIIVNDQIVNNLFFFDRKFVELATAGAHLNVIREFLNDPHYRVIPAEDYNFILAQQNARNGMSALPFHVDVRLQTPGESCWSMQTFLSLDKLDELNGALKVRPLSHLLPDMPDSSKNYKDAISINTDPGDLIIFYSKLHHSTAPNTNKKSGWTILTTYRSWWVKQQFDIWRMIGGKYSDLRPNQKLIMGACSLPSSNPFDSSSSRRGY